MKRLIFDLDNTLCVAINGDYINAKPKHDIIEQLRTYKEQGFEIVISTSRNMRTFAGDTDKIRTFTLPIIIEWLQRHNVPYDDIIIGKPWCGTDGFYIDDRAIRPNEFVDLTYAEIINLITTSGE